MELFILEYILKDFQPRRTSTHDWRRLWTAIDRLSIIWKSDLTDKMKRSFFQAAVVSILAIWMHHNGTLTKRLEEEAGRKLHKNVESSIKQVLATNTPRDSNYTDTCPPSQKTYTSSTNQTRGTLLEKQGRAHKWCTPVDPHSWMCKCGTTSTNLHTAAMWGHGL